MTAFANFVSDGGPLMYLILLVSITGLAISLERVYFLMVKNRVSAKKFWNKIVGFIHEDKIDEAISICEKADIVLAHILKEALKSYGKSEKILQNAVDEKSLELIPTIGKRIPYISVLANVSTLLGLLGTIVGLIQAFAAVGDADPSQKSALLANGISIAMNTTAAGLFVAILLVLSYSLINSTANRHIDEVDEFSVRLVNLLASKNYQ